MKTWEGKEEIDLLFLFQIQKNTTDIKNFPETGDFREVLFIVMSLNDRTGKIRECHPERIPGYLRADSQAPCIWH